MRASLLRAALAAAVLVAGTGACGGGDRSAGRGTTAPPATGPSAAGTSAAGTSAAGDPAGTVSGAQPSSTVAAAGGAPGTCHARRAGVYVLPDPACTPGATNPAVDQADIGGTICRSGWTATVRPPLSYTEPLKYQQMAAYGDTGPAGAYEEDHLVPLELGGSPTSPANLWPQPGATPNPKDSVEDAARRAVCAGRLRLAAAQQAIAADWVAFGEQLGVVAAGSATAPAAPTTVGSPGQTVAPGLGPAGGQAATCRASASYNPRYADWDVYVYSDQPDQTVRVTAGDAPVATYRTDASGYADVYLHAGAGAAGEAVTVTVGAASCSTTL